MPKDELNDYSATAALNTDVGGINTAEGWSPANVNNAIREIMSDIARVIAGTVRATNWYQTDGNISGTLTVGTLIATTFTPANLSTPGTLAVTGTSNLTGAVTAGSGIYEKRANAIASAATVNLSALAGNSVHITGTTTITAITLMDGQHVTVVFDEILTLTNGAGLVLPGAANLTTAAGLIARFVGGAGSVTRLLSYSRQASALITSGVTQATARLIGRTTAGTGAPEEITVGAGLTLAAGALSAGASGGITTIASGSLTGAAVVITNIPATYAYLVLQITGASSNTATRRPLVRVSSDNGASYDAVAANYVYHLAGIGGAFGAGADASVFDANTALGVADTATGTITITGYQGGPHMAFAFRSLALATNNLGNGVYVGSAAAINALQILWNGSGNFDAGTYALYGVS